MSDRKYPNVGELVELRQRFAGVNAWFPFMVTHIHRKAKTISGVCFNGLPSEVGWGNRGAQPMAYVAQGGGHMEWRFPKQSSVEEPELMVEADDYE